MWAGFFLILQAAFLPVAFAHTSEFSARYSITHPFGALRETRIGNVPHSPNFTIFGPVLHFMAVDLFQDEGTPVYAAHDGYLAFARGDLNQGWTTTLRVRRDDGLYTYYMHLDPATIPAHLYTEIAQGREVRVFAGDVIASLIRSPGHTLQPHLHFGMADCSKRLRLNPLLYLGIHDDIAPQIHAIEPIPIIQDRGKPDYFWGELDLTAEISDRWRGTDETYPPNRVEYQIRRVRKRGRPVVVASNVLFDATQIPFLRRTDGELSMRCETFSEIDSYATAFEAKLYRMARPSRETPQTFTYALTQKQTERAVTGPYVAPNWIKPYAGPWLTNRCDSRGQPLYPNGTYEIMIRASDIFGNSSTKKRRIEVRNPPCGVHE